MANEIEVPSKFGFKDKEKAQETLQLLEEHDIQYQRLTVRGLLGRAKRVLSITKAADKVANIKAAMEVFEQWQHENAASAKNAKTDASDKVDTVPGLGFKDKDAAKKTISILEDRDPDYQKLAVRGLLGNAKRVLSSTKDASKLSALKEGIAHLESWLEQFDAENRSRHNMAYLAADIMSKAIAGQASSDKLAAEFASVYTTEARGNYKHLRTRFPADDASVSWDIVRNRKLAELKVNLAKDDALFNESGQPTTAHLAFIEWAYSPQVNKLKEWIGKEKETTKRKAASDDSSTDSDSSNGESASKKRKQ